MIHKTALKLNLTLALEDSKHLWLGLFCLVTNISEVAAFQTLAAVTTAASLLQLRLAANCLETKTY